MKRFLKTLLLLIIVMCCFPIVFIARKAEASVISTIELQEVNDLDNTPYPNTTVVYYEYQRESYIEFKLDSPGQVKAILRCNIDTNTAGNAWISTDKLGDDIIGTISKFSGSETEISWFLESGTYYLFNTITHYPYEANIALLYEKSKVEEKKISTSFQNSSNIQLQNTVRGFLSNTNPNDYYSFEVDKKANVTIQYNFDASTGTGDQIGSCTLYDKNEIFLGEGTYSKTNKGFQEVTFLLEPGFYFVKLHGLYGNTALKIIPMYYDISLTTDTDPAWTDEPVEVNIDTGIDYSDIVVLFKDAKETLIDKDGVWSKTSVDYVPLDGETFKAKDSGTYSVRITDKYGNHTMQKIEISNVDITKPTIKGVTNKKFYRKPVTVTWSDKQSGINSNKTTLNGKKVNSGLKITKEGKYTLKVYDKVGNYRTVVFYIDYTAPSAGVEQGKTYNETVTLKFKDNISGMKKITVDNMEEAITKNTFYCYMDGEYTVELWDNAGNYVKLVFYIKKKY